MYNCYAQTDRATRGSSIAISNRYFHSQILKKKPSAVAVRLSLHKTITLCSVYIPPNYKLQPRELTELIQQLPGPCMILGEILYGEVTKSQIQAKLSKMCYRT